LEYTKKITFVGDSKLIIKILRKRSRQNRDSLTRTIHRIVKEEARFEEVEYYRVFITLNGIANTLAKEACQVEQGILWDKQ